MVFFLISQLKNASKHERSFIKVRKNQYNKQILNCLYNKGYINKFNLNDERNEFIVEIKNNSFFIEIRNLKLISKPSKRCYLTFSELSKKYKPTDFFIVSTSKGIFLGADIFFYGLGGELLVDNLKYK